jgi:hypothetical protein
MAATPFESTDPREAEKGDRMVEVTKERCDGITIVAEQHPHCRNVAACDLPARFLVRAFGNKRKVCGACLSMLKEKFPRDIEVLRMWE